MAFPDRAGQLEALLHLLPLALADGRLSSDILQQVEALTTAFERGNAKEVQLAWGRLLQADKQVADLLEAAPNNQAFSPTLVVFGPTSDAPRLNQDSGIGWMRSILETLGPQTWQPLVSTPERTAIGAIALISVALLPNGPGQEAADSRKLDIRVRLELPSSVLTCLSETTARLGLTAQEVGHGVCFPVRSFTAGLHSFSISFEDAETGNPAADAFEAQLCIGGERSAQPRPGPGARLAAAKAPSPDVELFFRKLEAPAYSYQLEVSCSACHWDHRSFPAVSFNMELGSYLQRRFSRPWLDSVGQMRHQGQPEAAEHMILAEGVELARGILGQYFLDAYRDELGPALAEQGPAAPRWLIYSEETWIPWELVALPGENSHRFLAELAVLTRWRRGRRSPERLCPGPVAVIIPRRNGDLPRPHDEIAAVRQLAQGECEYLGSLAEVLPSLQRTGLAGYHFHCHGRFDPDSIERSGLVLDGGVLRPSHIMNPLPAGTLKMGPLVFLNACRSAASGVGLSGVGGLVEAFLRQKAGAVVATSWPVPASTAETFATTFYQALGQGECLGVAAHQARQKARTLGDPTWLAYATWGHPSATILQR